MAHTAWLRTAKTRALLEQGGQCCYCYDNLSVRRATTEHVVPRCDGGSDRQTNIKASCRNCNEAKGSMSEPLFLRTIKTPRLTDAPFRFHLIWMRRRLNLKLNRSVRNLELMFGLEPCLASAVHFSKQSKFQ